LSCQPPVVKVACGALGELAARSSPATVNQERRVLELSSSLAGGTLVNLGDAVTGPGDGSIARPAILRASVNGWSAAASSPRPNPDCSPSHAAMPGLRASDRDT
jgi:hypothetical protein